MILRENSYKSLVGELKSAETEVNEIKIICAQALLLEIFREIEVLQIDTRSYKLTPIALIGTLEIS